MFNKKKGGFLMLNNIEQEVLVKKFQETNNQTYFEELVSAYRERIQGRAYNASLRFGLEDVDAESTLMMALWEAVNTWKEEKGVPFNKYASLKFNQALNHIFQSEVTRKDCQYELVYILASEGGYELSDPRQDVENIYAEEEAAKNLLDYLSSVRPILATVAALSASNYSYADIARIHGYKPKGVKDVRHAQVVWVGKRLKRARKPTLDYYKYVLKMDSLPIKLTL